MSEKLPRCPKCGAEIDSVSYSETGLLVYEAGSSCEWIKDGKPEIETWCTECGAKICLDELETAKPAKD